MLFDTYLQQIFDDGFFHADPHPGNLFITPLGEVSEDGPRAWQLTFIDFGMMGRVPENLKAGLRESVIAIGVQDGARLVKGMKALGVLLPGADTEMIERASMQLFDRFGGMDMSDLRTMDHSEMMSFGLQFRDLMLDLPFQLPENLLLLGRTVAILSGMCSGLDPDFNMWSAIAPYATRLISDEEQSTWQTLLDEGTKVLKTTVGLPARADRVMSLVERGELNVRTPLLDLRVRRVERSIRSVASALIFAALLLAGAILYGNEPTLAKWLMGASVLPLLTVMMGGRGRHPRM